MEPQTEEDWQTNRAPLPPRGEGEGNQTSFDDTLTAPPPLGRLNAPPAEPAGRIHFANRRSESEGDPGVTTLWLSATHPL
jgi:hypothetical protein